MKRTYLKRGIWHLGGRKKQKGDFLPLLGTVARPIFISAVGYIGGGILKGFGKNVWGEKKKL